MLPRERLSRSALTTPSSSPFEEEEEEEDRSTLLSKNSSIDSCHMRTGLAILHVYFSYLSSRAGIDLENLANLPRQDRDRDRDRGDSRKKRRCATVEG
ncbi:hypothetical protein HZH68_016953 [Vespula germanica]|uniref:Uncharacterized protein n=1 Tax=Vespula germanica TaxID=30212 RepID=A0A834IY06_VESGE|nr:hypothetical protein HZH68_016953 [Vespula germanica]